MRRDLRPELGRVELRRPASLPAAVGPPLPLLVGQSSVPVPSVIVTFDVSRPLTLAATRCAMPETVDGSSWVAVVSEHGGARLRRLAP